MARMHITDFTIQEGPGKDTAEYRLYSSLRPITPPPPVPGERQGDLRLIALASFVWGTSGNPPRPRTRPENTLIWVASGSVQIEFPRQSRVAGPDTVRYIPAGTAFAVIPQPGANGYALLLPASIGHDTEPEFPQNTLSGHIGHAKADFREILEELAAPGETSEKRQLLSRLTAALANLQPARPVLRSAAPASGEPGRLVERFSELALARLSGNHTIAELAEELQVRTAVLDRACQTLRGKRAIELVNDLRMARAAEMLREGRHDPAQIAKELGYTSYTHFIRAFVSVTGRNPENFRTQLVSS